MAIVVRIDVLLAQRKMRAKVLAEALGLTEAQLSKLRNGHVKGIKFDTLDALCRHLGCTPGDILDHDPGMVPQAVAGAGRSIATSDPDEPSW